MNYRITSEFAAPFKIKPIIFEISNYKLEMNLDIKATFPKNIVAGIVLI